MIGNKHRSSELMENMASNATNTFETVESFSFEPHASDILAKNYRMLASQMEERPKTILYPCCATDVTPSIAFPDAEVKYVDMDRRAMEALVSYGYNAFVRRVPTGEEEETSSSDSSEPSLFIQKDQVDLLILLNPQIPPFAIVDYVRHKGYILCNNYHQTADDIHSCHDFTPVAVLHVGEKQELDTSSLGAYFRLLYTDEEYKLADSERYKIIQQYVYGKIRMLFQSFFDVSHAIPQYLKEARGQHEMFDTVFIGKHSLPKPLREKRSDADDLFLFKRQE